MTEMALADTFNGGTDKLIQCIEAIVALDADGALVPHGLSNNARELLSSAAVRLAATLKPEQSLDCDWPVCGCEDHDGPCRYSPATPPQPAVSGEVREAINETICKHVRAYYDGIKGNREAADAILALSHFTAQSEALAEVRERLDSSQSLLAMLYQIGPDQPVWKAEEVDKLLADQMSENRAAIAKIDAASPSRVEGE